MITCPVVALPPEVAFMFLIVIDPLLERMHYVHIWVDAHYACKSHVALAGSHSRCVALNGSHSRAVHSSPNTQHTKHKHCTVIYANTVHSITMSSAAAASPYILLCCAIFSLLLAAAHTTTIICIVRDYGKNIRTCNRAVRSTCSAYL